MLFHLFTSFCKFGIRPITSERLKICSDLWILFRRNATIARKIGCKAFNDSIYSRFDKQQGNRKKCRIRVCFPIRPVWMTLDSWPHRTSMAHINLDLYLYNPHQASTSYQFSSIDTSVNANADALARWDQGHKIFISSFFSLDFASTYKLNLNRPLNLF